MGSPADGCTAGRGRDCVETGDPSKRRASGQTVGLVTWRKFWEAVADRCRRATSIHLRAGGVRTSETGKSPGLALSTSSVTARHQTTPVKARLRRSTARESGPGAPFPAGRNYRGPCRSEGGSISSHCDAKRRSCYGRASHTVLSSPSTPAGVARRRVGM